MKPRARSIASALLLVVECLVQATAHVLVHRNRFAGPVGNLSWADSDFLAFVAPSFCAFVLYFLSLRPLIRNVERRAWASALIAFLIFWFALILEFNMYGT
jgi:hypothetical protein